MGYIQGTICSIIGAESLHLIEHARRLLEGGGVSNEPSRVSIAVIGRDGLRTLLLEKMAIRKEITKNVGVPKRETENTEESHIRRQEGWKEKTGMNNP